MRKTRGGWGERVGGGAIFSRQCHRSLPQIARVLFSLGLFYFRDVPTIYDPGTVYRTQTCRQCSVSDRCCQKVTNVYTVTGVVWIATSRTQPFELNIKTSDSIPSQITLLIRKQCFLTIRVDFLFLCYHLRVSDSLS